VKGPSDFNVVTGLVDDVAVAILEVEYELLRKNA
jgi:hypothetical protein